MQNVGYKTNIPNNEITFSMLQTFQNCRQKYFWRYIREIVPKRTQCPKLIGKAFHKCIELISKDKIRADAAVNFTFSKFEDEFSNSMDNCEEISKQSAIVNAMVEGYLARFGCNHPIAELKFRNIIQNIDNNNKPVFINGKADGIIHHKDTNTFDLLELKTFTYSEPNLLTRIKLDFQTTIYFFEIQKLVKERIDKTLTGITIRRVRKPSIKIGKNSLMQFSERLKSEYFSKQDWYFEEAKFIRNKNDEEQYQKKIVDIYKDMQLCHAENRFYQNSTNCRMFSNCEYLQLCSDYSPEFEKLYFIHEPANSELID